MMLIFGGFSFKLGFYNETNGKEVNWILHAYANKYSRLRYWDACTFVASCEKWEFYLENRKSKTLDILCMTYAALKSYLVVF